eukprot:gene20415-biopygen7058
MIHPWVLVMIPRPSPVVSKSRLTQGEQDTGAGVARAWRGRGAGYRHFFGLGWRGRGAGTARAWRGHFLFPQGEFTGLKRSWARR